MAPASTNQTRWDRAGFTLIELLIVIAIVALLISLLFPAVRHCTYLSRQARELAAAQQLMVAFNLYANDHGGKVIPGYPPKSWVNGEMAVYDDGGARLRNETAQRYPWRLAPYLDFNFQGLYKDTRLLTEIKENEDYYRRIGVDYPYVISLFPSLAMNVAFVGGSDQHLGFNDAARRLYGDFYLTRIDQARRPTDLIVFVSARAELQTLLPQVGPPQGYFKAEPPYFSSRKWQATYDRNAQFPGLNSGYVALRPWNEATVAVIDGHGGTLDWAELQDMRHWADPADRPDWVLERR